MALTPGKYRLGAPDSIVLDLGTANPVDLGTSQQGFVWTYHPTMFKMKIDQSPGMVATWRTDEEVSIEVSLAELQMQKLLAAMSYPTTGVTTVVASTLSAPSAPVITQGGAAGSSSYSYQVVAFNSNGDSIPSTATATTTGATTLTSTNYNIVTWTAVAGAVGYRVVRSAGGSTQGVITPNLGLGPSVLTFSDTGLAATAYVAIATAPASPNTDTASIGGNVSVPIHTLDVAVPKNDGTNNHWRMKWWKVFADADTAVDHKRDKNSEYKVKLGCLVDLSRPVGTQYFQLIEEY